MIKQKEKDFSYYARLEDLHLTNERIDRKIREEIKKSLLTPVRMSPELAEHSQLFGFRCFLCLGISIHKMRE